MAMEGKCRGDKVALDGSKSMAKVGFGRGKLVGKFSQKLGVCGEENKQIEAPTCKLSMEAWSRIKVQPI